MKRSDVLEQYKWNKGDIFASVADWEKLLGEVNTDMVGVLRFKGRLGIKDSLVDYFNFTDDLSKKIELLYTYAMFSRVEDLKDTRSSELISLIQTLLVNYNSYSAFATSELAELDETTLKNYIDDPQFAPYDYLLTTILKKKKHILSSGEERILALSGKAMGSFSEIFSQIDNVDLPLPAINVDGEKQQLTHGKYSLFLQHGDQAVRKRAFKGMYGAIESLINTITANLIFFTLSFYIVFSYWYCLPNTSAITIAS